MKLDFRCM